MDARPLSLRLRQATAEAHKQAERHSFVSAMLRGQVQRDAYARYLASLRAVYAALEDALDDASPFSDPALFRTPAITRDLEALGQAPPPTAAAVTWADHLARLPQHRLAGHAYTRYLGDLSGGQQIGRRLVSTGLLPDAATGFYSFPQISDIRMYKAMFRESLDRLGEQIGEQQVEEVVEEARCAFRWSADLFEEASG